MASSLHSNVTFLSPYPSKITTKTNFTTVRCGPRGNRPPLVKGRVLSTEAIQAVQSLKRAHRTDPAQITDLLSKTLSRLIKSDLIASFNELLRQDQYHLALRVFSAIRSEDWYETDWTLYGDLVAALARNGMAEDIDRLIGDLEMDMEGAILCDKGVLTMIKAVIAAGRGESTARIYRLMKRSGWRIKSAGDEYVARVLSKGLRRLGIGFVADEIDLEIRRLSRGILDKVAA